MNRRSGAAAWVLIAAIGILPALAGCVGRSDASGPLVLGDPRTSGLDAWPGQFDVRPTAYDIDGDGVAEIIAHSSDRNVYVFDSQNGKALAKIPTRYPPAWHVERILNDVEVAVLRPGEPPSLIITNHAAYVAAWQFVPAKSKGDRFHFEKSWETRTDGCYRSPGMDAGPAVADLNGDGIQEILVQTEEIGFFALRANGTVLWKQCWAGGNSAPVVADLNGDRRPEVVVASDSGFIAVVDGASGATQWTFDARQHGVQPASVAVSPTVAELDGQAPMEVLFVARDASHSDPDEYALNHMAIFAVHQNTATWQSEVLWMRQPTWANPLSYTRLVVEDVDDDGSADIFGMDWNTIGHRPGDWERLGPANVFRLDARGQDVWVREIDAWWSNQDIAIADFNGDGQLEVLANGPGTTGSDGLWRLAVEDGSANGFLAVAPWKMLRGPSLHDLGDNGTMQLVFPVVRDEEGSTARGAILVYDLRVAYNVG